jgi:hypothetical protein
MQFRTIFAFLVAAADLCQPKGKKFQRRWTKDVPRNDTVNGLKRHAMINASVLNARGRSG